MYGAKPMAVRAPPGDVERKGVAPGQDQAGVSAGAVVVHARERVRLVVAGGDKRNRGGRDDDVGIHVGEVAASLALRDGGERVEDVARDRLDPSRASR